MRTNYLSKFNSKTKTKAKPQKSFLFLLLSGIIIFVVFFFIWKLSASSLYSWGNSIWSRENAFGSMWSNVGSFFADRTALLAQITELEQKADEESLLAEEAKAKAAAYDALLATPGTEKSHIEAKVVRRPPLSAFDTIVIDRGQAEGVKQGDLVAYGDLSIGTVTEVLAHSSRVDLFTSPGSRFRVEIGSNGFESTAVGQGGGSFAIVLAQDAHVAEGDSVRGLAREAPLYGVIEHIESKPDATEKTAYASMPFPLSLAEWVQVITP